MELDAADYTKESSDGASNEWYEVNLIITELPSKIMRMTASRSVI